MPYNTRTGTSEHGVCSFCGADKVLSPKSGKVFCSEKCWLKTSPNAPQDTQRQFTPQSNTNIPLDQFLTKEAFNKTLDAQRKAFSEMSTRIAELTKQLDYFKELWKTQNPNAFEVHKDQIPVIGAENFEEEAGKILGIK